MAIITHLLNCEQEEFVSVYDDVSELCRQFQ